MEEIDIVKYLIEVAPVVGVLGWWIYSLKKEKKELQQYMRETDRERDKVLDNLANVIEKIMDTVSVLPNGLSHVLQNELKVLLAEIKAILLNRSNDK
jgi:acetolactate synthase small subunit